MVTTANTADSVYPSIKGPAKVSGRQLKEENPNYTFKELTDKLETKFADTGYLLQLKGKLCNIKQKNQTAAQLNRCVGRGFLES